MCLGALAAGSGRTRRTGGRGDSRLSRERLSAIRRAWLIAICGFPSVPVSWRIIYQDSPSAASPSTSCTARRCSIATESTAAGQSIFRTTTCASPCFRWRRSAWRAICFRPQILHLHDWQAALAPVYLREHFRGDPTFIGVKTLLHHPQSRLPGNLSARQRWPQIGWTAGCSIPEQLEFFGKRQSPQRRASPASDAVSTVSKGYAREIQTPGVRIRSGRISCASTRPSTES